MDKVEVIRDPQACVFRIAANLVDAARRILAFLSRHLALALWIDRSAIFAPVSDL